MEINDAANLFAQYLLVEKGLSKKTVDAYLTDLKLFFKYFKDKKDTEDLNPYDINSFMLYGASLGRKPSTTLRRAASIKHFYLFHNKSHSFTIKFRYPLQFFSQINIEINVIKIFLFFLHAFY